jgi:hypothetical protein
MSMTMRRREEASSGEQARTPSVWEPLVTLPWNAEPPAQLRTVTRLLDELLGDWPGAPAVLPDDVSTPLGDLEVDPDGVEASIEDGVLTIWLPKPAAERRESSRIAVGQPGDDRPAVG